MKVLLLISESWNDSLHPNNNMTTWFEGMDGVELAVVYGNPALPQNKCCKRYFQLSEGAMVKSLLGGKKAGRTLIYPDFPPDAAQCANTQSTSPYKLFKKISCETVRFLKDLIWATGRYNKAELKKFIDDFSPDIIFTQRMGSIKMCRMERIVRNLCSAPMVAYTGDDEFSLKQFSLSPMFWIRRFWLRNALKKAIPHYRIFYSQSQTQMEEFRKKFQSDTRFLVKCGQFQEQNIHTSVNLPIQLVYAGKLYCNRWKTLALLANCIRQINQDEIKFVLNIYTRDPISKKQNRSLNDGIHSVIHGPATAPELKQIFREADIALHVEGIDLKNRLRVKYSFSTKIMECLSSGCAVMAICNEHQAGYAYLQNENAAFLAFDQATILHLLSEIASQPHLVLTLAQSAYACGVRNHQREDIQKKILNDFQSACHGK